jgi:hypothetical protein
MHRTVKNAVHDVMNGEVVHVGAEHPVRIALNPQTFVGIEGLSVGLRRPVPILAAENRDGTAVHRPRRRTIGQRRT